MLMSASDGQVRFENPFEPELDRTERRVQVQGSAFARTWTRGSVQRSGHQDGVRTANLNMNAQSILGAILL